MSTTLTAGVREARDGLADLLERDEPTIITRRGREIAAVLPIDEWRHYQELAARELHDLLEARAPELTQPGYTLADILKETLDRAN